MAASRGGGRKVASGWRGGVAPGAGVGGFQVGQDGGRGPRRRTRYGCHFGLWPVRPGTARCVTPTSARETPASTRSPWKRYVGVEAVDQEVTVRRRRQRAADVAQPHYPDVRLLPGEAGQVLRVADHAPGIAPVGRVGTSTAT